MTAEDTRIQVELFYKLLSSSNIDAVIQLLSDDIEWNIPGNEQLAPWTGKKIGQEGVRTYFDYHEKHIENIVFNVSQVLVDKENAVAVGYLSSRLLKTGKIYNSHFFTHFIFSDKKITKYLFSEDSWQLTNVLRDTEGENVVSVTK